MGIHFTYKNSRSAKLMEKQAKKERKLAEKRAKRAERALKDGSKKEENKKLKLDPNEALSLDFLTNPNKEWVQKRKTSV